MAKLIVSLISDQTIPNIMLIKETGPFDKYIFLSTNAMEKKGKVAAICHVCGIKDEQVVKMIVSEDSLEDNHLKLSGFDYSKYCEIYVNITGGTKIMSLAAYTFFSKLDSQIFYLPIKKNIYEKFSKGAESTVKYHFKKPLSLHDYLYSYSIEIKNFDEINRLVMPVDFTRNFMNLFMTDDSLKNIISDLRKLTSDRSKVDSIQKHGLKVSSVKKLSDFLSIIGIPSREMISYKELEYFIGGWFEEYFYDYLRIQAKLFDEQIGIKVKIEFKKAQNEFDVIFVKDYTLYVIECKSGFSNVNNEYKSKIEEVIYKLSSLKNKFGLNVKSYLVTLADLSIDNSHLISTYSNRAKSSEVIIYDRKYFLKPSMLKNIIKEMTENVHTKIVEPNK